MKKKSKQTPKLPTSKSTYYGPPSQTVHENNSAKRYWQPCHEAPSLVLELENVGNEENEEEDDDELDDELDEVGVDVIIFKSQQNIISVSY